MISDLFENMKQRGATKEELDKLEELINKYYPEWWRIKNASRHV